MMTVINIELNSKVKLTKLPFQIAESIKSYCTLDNPKFIEAEKRGYWTGGISKKIYCYQQMSEYLHLYRGYISSLLPYLQQCGIHYHITDNRRILPEVDFTFHGNLREYQQRAVKDALQKDFGLLVAPCGSGKTTMGLYIVAKRRQPTLVITHTKELLNQWVSRINQYLGIPTEKIGIIGNGKEKISPITVSMVQTLHRRDLSEITKHFGFIIIDECQHTPSTTFTEVVSSFDSKYMLGLSATPYRRDRLNKLIYLTVGNVIAQVTDDELKCAGNRIKPEIIERHTTFNYDYCTDSDYQPMISALIEDDERNKLIASDIRREYKANGNYCLILSDRKSHCELLANLLQKQDIVCAVLTGDISKKAREAVIKQLNKGILRIVLATGALAGEGLDVPHLNRLFITTPIRWKGRIKQYAGRVMRPAQGKHNAKIFDYVDAKVGILQNAYQSRCYTVYNRLK